MFQFDRSVPKSEIDARIDKLQKELQKNDLEAAIVLQPTDLFYFSGTGQQAHLFIPAEGAPVLMVLRNFKRACAESPLDRVVAIKHFGEVPACLRQNGYPAPRYLGLECDVLPANLYFKYRQIFENAPVTDISPQIRLIRSEKSHYEIDMIREAARLMDEVAAHFQEILREGATEIELAGILEARARKLGHQGLVRMRLWGNEMFYGHLLSGADAAVPSYLSSPTGGSGVNPLIAQGPGLKPVGRYEPVLLDYVFVYQGYLADSTRIYAIGGLPEELMAAHAAMLDIQRRLKEEIRPGIEAGKVYALAMEQAAALGYGKNFMGTEEHSVPFVGHGIGLELDEFPFLAKGQTMKLKAGMVIALEPKAVFPGMGVVGIENTHLVTEHGLEQLTHFKEQVTIV